MCVMLQDLDREEVNIVTLEDPVEYYIPGVNQCQINEKTGMTFASGLRSILRQDPDIIAVGEIRDSETAHIAIRAAITGHLVLSTLHTNDAISAVTRLRDMGVEPWLISGALRGVISQRLVRKICPHCKRAYKPPIEELEALGLPQDDSTVFYRGEGCPECHHTGYIGRRGGSLEIPCGEQQAGAFDRPGRGDGGTVRRRKGKRLCHHAGELPVSGAERHHHSGGGRPRYYQHGGGLKKPKYNRERRERI